MSDVRIVGDSKYFNDLRKHVEHPDNCNNDEDIFTALLIEELGGLSKDTPMEIRSKYMFAHRRGCLKKKQGEKK